MFVVHFVEYLKDVLENCLFVLKTQADLYILSLELKMIFVHLSVAQRGCNWN